jgi:hypothetical protein
MEQMLLVDNSMALPAVFFVTTSILAGTSSVNRSSSRLLSAQ